MKKINSNINERNITMNEYAAYSWILGELFGHVKIDTISFSEIKRVIRENMKAIVENYGFKSISIRETALMIRVLGKYERIFWWLDEVLCDNDIPLSTKLWDLECCYDGGFEWSPNLNQELNKIYRAYGVD